MRTVSPGRAPGPLAVSYPAHWGPAAIESLRAVLDATTPLVSDAQAALIALGRDPGVPSRGVIAVCDFGGTGTSLTLVDMGRGGQPPSLAPTVRHTDLSGDLIDQALLRHVIEGLSEAGTIDLSSTSAIGSLGRLRAQCRTPRSSCPPAPSRR